MQRTGGAKALDNDPLLTDISIVVHITSTDVAQ